MQTQILIFRTNRSFEETKPLNFGTFQIFAKCPFALKFKLLVLTNPNMHEAFLKVLFTCKKNYSDYNLAPTYLCCGWVKSPKYITVADSVLL